MNNDRRLHGKLYLNFTVVVRTSKNKNSFSLNKSKQILSEVCILLQFVLDTNCFPIPK